jgi:hypothetical protein
MDTRAIFEVADAPLRGTIDRVRSAKLTMSGSLPLKRIMHMPAVAVDGF